MSFAFLPFYTGDYLRDTRHLTPLKHGVYVLLLMHCWDQRGPLPLDEQECAGIANCRSADEIESLRYVLDRFFVRMSDGFYNTRMQKEVDRAREISSKREDAGRRGANERMRRFRESQALAKQVLSKSQASDATPTPTTTTTTKEQLLSARSARASRLGIQDLPREWKAFCQRERPELDPGEVFARFRDYWIAKPGKDGRKLDWFATWRNWVRNTNDKTIKKSVSTDI